MSEGAKYNFKFVLGIVISILCVYLAFRKIDFRRTLNAFEKPDYWFLAPAIGVLFISHFLRTLRWRYLLDPIGRFDIYTLFSSLMIGYGVNTFMPAHLGEFPRAYVLSKKGRLSFTQIIATIIMERFIDVFSLFAMMLMTLHIYQFPDWVKNSGYITFGVALSILVLFIIMKNSIGSTVKLIRYVTKPLENIFDIKIEGILLDFLSSVKPLKRSCDYIMVGCLSAMIWLCNYIVFYFCLRAFSFIETNALNLTVGLILLVITSIAIVIPSSPGYVGTYHYFCQATLSMFGIPADSALSFAIVLHGVNFFPVFVAGLIFAYRNSVDLFKLQGNDLVSRKINNE